MAQSPHSTARVLLGSSLNYSRHSSSSSVNAFPSDKRKSPQIIPLFPVAEVFFSLCIRERVRMGSALEHQVRLVPLLVSTFIIAHVFYFKVKLRRAFLLAENH